MLEEAAAAVGALVEVATTVEAIMAVVEEAAAGDLS